MYWKIKALCFTNCSIRLLLNWRVNENKSLLPQILKNNVIRQCKSVTNWLTKKPSYETSGY